MLGLKNEFNDMVKKKKWIWNFYTKWSWEFYTLKVYFQMYSNLRNLRNVKGNHQVVLTTASEEKQKIYTMWMFKKNSMNYYLKLYFIFLH